MSTDALVLLIDTGLNREADDMAELHISFNSSVRKRL